MGWENQRFGRIWLFFSIALASASGAAQLIAAGIGRWVLGVICGVALALAAGQFAWQMAGATPARHAREREAMREALGYLADTADTQFRDGKDWSGFSQNFVPR